MTAPGNASKITDIPLVKTRVVIGWIPVSVLFPGGGSGELGGSSGTVWGECSTPGQHTQIVATQT